MARKAPDGGGKAAAINFRTETALRDRIEAAAKKAGRSIAEEVEARLYASLEFDLSEREGIRYVLSRNEMADFCNDIGKVFSDIKQLGRRRKFDEVQTREAMRAALGVLSFYYLWIGEDEPPALDGPAPEPGARLTDLPPQPLGHEIANGATIWNAAWREGSVIDETADGQISDVWSGDGTKVVRPGRNKSAPPREALSKAEFETPERLRLYRPVRSFRMKSEGAK